MRTKMNSLEKIGQRKELKQIRQLIINKFLEVNELITWHDRELERLEKFEAQVNARKR